MTLNQVLLLTNVVLLVINVGAFIMAARMVAQAERIAGATHG